MLQASACYERSNMRAPWPHPIIRSNLVIWLLGSLHTLPCGPSASSSIFRTASSSGEGGPTSELGAAGVRTCMLASCSTPSNRLAFSGDHDADLIHLVTAIADAIGKHKAGSMAQGNSAPIYLEQCAAQSAAADRLGSSGTRGSGTAALLQTPQCDCQSLTWLISSRTMSSCSVSTASCSAV